MRHYQRKRDNPYQLPHNVYMQCLYAVRDYDRLRKEMEDILYAAPGTPDGMPRGSETSDQTGDKAVKREALRRRCETIEQALMLIPVEYRRGVLNGTMYGCFPDDANPETYRRWRRRFLYQIAKNKCML